MSVEERLALAAELQFLGEEFLTWLWFRSEMAGGRIDLQGEMVEVVFERFIVLEGVGPGSSAKSTLVSRGAEADLSDAKGGLALGKKVAKAHLNVAMGDRRWRFTLAGPGLVFSSFRLPEDGDEEGELDHAGRVMDRLGLMEEAISVVERLFDLFLDIRMDNRRWVEEKRGLRRWISQG